MVIMESRRDIWINFLIIFSLMLGYVIGIGPANILGGPRSISFETASKADLVPLNQAQLNQQTEGGRAPVEGGPATLSQFRGRNVLIHFWASWCQSCAIEKTIFNRLAETFRGRPVEIVGIASSDSLEAIENSGILEGVTYPMFLDRSGALAKALSIKFLPQTLLVDTKGHIRHHVQGALDDSEVDDLKREIDDLMEEERAPADAPR